MCSMFVTRLNNLQVGQAIISYRHVWQVSCKTQEYTHNALLVHIRHDGQSTPDQVGYSAKQLTDKLARPIIITNEHK